MNDVEVRKHLQAIKNAIENHDREILRLRARERDLQAQVEDLEVRARTHERRADENAAKADRVDELEELCAKLLSTLDALPTRMADAAMIPGLPGSDVGLYATYDWQHVMDAKFALKKVMKGENSERQDDSGASVPK